MYVIGLGSDVNETFLQEIASITGGEYYFAPTSSNLSSIFEEIAGEINNIAATSVTVTDVLPANVDFAGPVPANCVYDDGTRTLTCTRSAISIGEGWSLSFNVIITESGASIPTNALCNYTYAAANGSTVSGELPSPVVSVNNEAPSIESMSATPNPANRSQTVDFAAGASDANGDALYYYWVFGDGTQATGATPSHVFDAENSYTVTVTVTDGSLNDSQSLVVEVVSGCEYSDWTNGACVSDGSMQQTRTDASGYGYCLELEQTVANSTCACVQGDNALECITDGYRQHEHEWSYGYCGETTYTNEADQTCACVASETGRTCNGDGSASVDYAYNFGYCDAAYSQTEGDAECACDYTAWLDENCASDGFMDQARTDTSGYAYCTELEQTVANQDCACTQGDNALECITDGYRQHEHEWSYGYCGETEYTNEADTSCACTASETGRACVSDGFADVSYDWNYGYCEPAYVATEEDAACASVYECTEWANIDNGFGGCTADGEATQTRTCTDQYGGQYDEEQTATDANCDCFASPVNSVCTDDGFANVDYNYNFGYCGEGYTLNEAATECACQYSGWETAECASEGIVNQVRTDSSGYAYCLSLTQTAADSACDCQQTDSPLECITSGYRQHEYAWNEEYCGSTEYYNIEDASCNSVYNCTEWANIDNGLGGCTADGEATQTRTCTDQYGNAYDEEQTAGDEACGCADSETGRACVEDGSASVDYAYNFGYCGENYQQSEDDASCACQYTSWTNAECASDGVMNQFRTDGSGFNYCTALTQTALDSQCACVAGNNALECITDGYRQHEYPWNYGYCGTTGYGNEADASCACAPVESSRVCTGNGTADVTYGWNFGYCGEGYVAGETDYSCDSSYECGEWSSDGCTGNGVESQTRTCTDQYQNSYDESRAVENAECACVASESSRECASDGFASVGYAYNFGYCGEGYQQTEEDGECDAVYECGEWTNIENGFDGCTSDGNATQTRTCTDQYGNAYDEEQTVANDECGCTATPTESACAADGVANVTYGWNYDYCGEGYAQDEESEACACWYTEWVNVECSDGLMGQSREQTGEMQHEYCTVLTQQVEDGQCVQATPTPTPTPTEVPQGGGGGSTSHDITLLPTGYVRVSAPEPTPAPTAEPTVEPTPEPSATPTPEPSVEPTPEPTIAPAPVSPQTGLFTANQATWPFWLLLLAAFASYKQYRANKKKYGI